MRPAVRWRITEAEQAVVSACYSAFAQGHALKIEGVMAEIERTVPLSVTMQERIDHMRAWSRGRAVTA